MTTEEIKQMVDDGRAEQLTAQLCRHWEIATQRMESLVKELDSGMDTNVEAEVYAVVMRLQSSMMALAELNKMPCVYLFSEYVDRIAKAVSDTTIRQAAMTLLGREMRGTAAPEGRTSFFDFVMQSLSRHLALPAEEREATRQKVLPPQQMLAFCARYVDPEDMAMVFGALQDVLANGGDMTPDDLTSTLSTMREAMDDLAARMAENRQTMLIWLLALIVLPGLTVNIIREHRTDSKAMAQLFKKVLMRVRESTAWWNYWRDRRETLQVVSEGCSMKDIMTAERAREREMLGQVRGGLFAKYTTDPEAFEANFLDAHLSDDDMRSFIFHLTALSEIARELDPSTKFGEEQLVLNDLQRVGEAVMEAAGKLSDLVEKSWEPYYNKMWQELIENEEVFARLKVTRNSPHNNLFTARFFCHLVGEMKKRAVFGAHSDGNLAEKLTSRRYVGTFRKNIQESMGDESEKTRNIFNTIYQKYNHLVHPVQ